ncbi:RibD family protein [Sphingomonas sp. AP4-R1]|uniref:RibD family protein n=1 Tax=Sphingomonas sp. AP4-R1 TaxID=2735134 RepID=UPI0014937F5F|nr:RibD family protein [Sphingomonas sp. AP4-R1]QJU58397.1 RibD family protein [Sphingomonas sp. AP4-R1]
MPRPRITCHMASSIDGRILPQRWSPTGAHSHETYDRLHERLGGGSWIVGRATGQEFAKREAYPQDTTERFPRTAWLPKTDATAYAIVTDAHGKIAWGRADVGGDPIIVLLTEQVSDSHLAGLRGDGVGYVFAGTESFDLDAAMSFLKGQLHIDHLLLEGGGHINGALLRAGMVDEISLMIVPAIDGAGGAPATFDGPDSAEGLPIELTALVLEEHELLNGGILWLRYRIERSTRSASRR